MFTKKFIKNAINMKTLWIVIGIIVLLALIAFIYKSGQKNAQPTNLQTILSSITQPKNETPTTEKIIEQPVIQPVIIKDYTDCLSQTYQDNVFNLRDIYLQKRAIWNNGIKTNDPMTAQYRKDMNDAYNTYYYEAIKCNLLNK